MDKMKKKTTRPPKERDCLNQLQPYNMIAYAQQYSEKFKRKCEKKLIS